VKRGKSEQAEIGRLKTVHRHNIPPVAQWDPRPATCCWMTCQMSQTGPKSVESKETRLFSRSFLLNYIPVQAVLYCDFGF